MKRIIISYVVHINFNWAALTDIDLNISLPPTQSWHPGLTRWMFQGLIQLPGHVFPSP
jgi:hypothetical protein